MIGPDLHARPAVAADGEGRIRSVAESAHAELGEHQPRVEPAGHVHAGVDHARSGRKRVNPDAKVVRARDIAIGERPRPLVHPELTHSFLPTHEDHEEREGHEGLYHEGRQSRRKGRRNMRIAKPRGSSYSSCFLVFVFFEIFVNFAKGNDDTARVRTAPGGSRPADDRRTDAGHGNRSGAVRRRATHRRRRATPPSRIRHSSSRARASPRSGRAARCAGRPASALSTSRARR